MFCFVFICSYLSIFKISSKYEASRYVSWLNESRSQKLTYYILRHRILLICPFTRFSIIKITKMAEPLTVLKAYMSADKDPGPDFLADANGKDHIY